MSLKDQIEREFGIPVRLRAGAPGSLNVFVNGERIHSRKEAGHSVSPAEIVRLIRQRSAAS